jgi:hypothetical protein
MNGATTRFEDTVDLALKWLDICNVLEHVRREDDVKCSVGERDMATVIDRHGKHTMGSVAAGFLDVD